jgi:hypothetical protein
VTDDRIAASLREAREAVEKLINLYFDNVPADELDREQLAETVHEGLSDEWDRLYRIEATASSAVPAPATDRAAVLTAAERTMLAYALDQAQEKIWSEDGFTDEDQAAVTSLRRMADETPQHTEAVDLPTLAAALDGIHGLIATSSRDWGTYRVDAWLWAVLCGWDCEEAHVHDELCDDGGAMREMAERHGWDDDTVAKARRYRAAVRVITEPAVVAQPDGEADTCPAAHGALGRICELPIGHAGMHTGAGPNGGAVWQGDAS